MCGEEERKGTRGGEFMRRLIIVGICMGVETILGCAAPVHDRTMTKYVNPEFTADSVRAGGLALFPIARGGSKEDYRIIALQDSLNAALKSAAGTGRLMTWEACTDSLNHHHLGMTYRSLIDAYQDKSMVDRYKIEQLQKAVGVKYGLLCILQGKSDLLMFLEGRVITSDQVGDAVVRCLVLDLSAGDVMREIIGEAESRQNVIFWYNPAYEVRAGVIARAIADQVYGGKNK